MILKIQESVGVINKYSTSWIDQGFAIIGSNVSITKWDPFRTRFPLILSQIESTGSMEQWLHCNSLRLTTTAPNSRILWRGKWILRKSEVIQTYFSPVRVQMEYIACCLERLRAIPGTLIKSACRWGTIELTQMSCKVSIVLGFEVS